MFSRSSDASICLRICARESPRSRGPIGKNTFVASTYESRGYAPRISPQTRSASPCPYTFAVSNSVIPASIAAFVHASVCSCDTPPPYVSHDPSATVETVDPRVAELPLLHDVASWQA